MQEDCESYKNQTDQAVSDKQILEEQLRDKEQVLEYVD